MAHHTWAQEVHSRRLTNSGWPLLVSSHDPIKLRIFLHLFIQFQLNVACVSAVQPAAPGARNKRNPQVSHPCLDRLLPTWTLLHAYGRSVRVPSISAPSHVAHVHVNLITVVVAAGLGSLFLSNSLLCLNDRLLLSPTSCCLPIDKCYM